jgi:hypothetical protein
MFSIGVIAGSSYDFFHPQTDDWVHARTRAVSGNEVLPRMRKHLRLA